MAGCSLGRHLHHPPASQQVAEQEGRSRARYSQVVGVEGHHLPLWGWVTINDDVEVACMHGAYKWRQHPLRRAYQHLEVSAPWLRFQQKSEQDPLVPCRPPATHAVSTTHAPTSARDLALASWQHLEPVHQEVHVDGAVHNTCTTQPANISKQQLCVGAMMVDSWSLPGVMSAGHLVIAGA
jgi:hypothetical protein